MNELHYFPGSPTVSTLGWPILTGPSAKGPAEFFSHSNVPSPTVEHVSFAQHAHGVHNGQAGDMDLDVGYSFGSMNMAMVDVHGAIGASASGVSPGGQHAHAQAAAAAAAADMMAFGVPELGVGYHFDPNVHSQVALDFSAEELAIMDQICRQQGGSVMFAVGQPVG